jgi:transposase, IS5 family
VWVAGTRRGVTPSIKKKLKLRNAVERVIGHMKNDGRLGRSFIKGIVGDAINALLCGADHNLRKILRQLALLCAQFWRLLQQLTQQQNSNVFQQHQVAA